MSSQRIAPRWPSTSSQTAPLAQPLTFPFSGRTAPNRFLKAATSERLCSFDGVSSLSERGIPSPELVRAYERFGRGGWGQILTGNIMISLTDLEAPGNAIIPPGAPFSGPRFEAFKALAKAGQVGWDNGNGESGRSLMVGQISHSGRQVQEALQPHPISASAVQLVKPGMGKFGMPRAATKEEIKEVVENFAHAAEYLEKAGFDGVELHGAHGYLIAQFLSETTNQRTDEYGGSLQNRMRFVLEIGAAIKKRVSSDFVVGIKVNSVEFQERGFTPEEAVVLCKALETAGFDYVETSGGTLEKMAFAHEKESTARRENYFIEFAERIASAVHTMKVYTTGGLRTVGGMLGTLESVDGVGFGRGAIQEPSFPADILSGKITGAMKCAIPDDNLMGQLIAIGFVFQELSRGEEPSDLSDPEVVQKFLANIPQQH